MTRRPSLLKKIWRKLVSPKSALPAKPAKKPVVAERKVISSLESLEGRIAPAALINPTTLVYKDFDGDIVTVKFSKALFTSANAALNEANANTVFKLTNAGGTATSVTVGAFNPASAPEQLRLIDVNAVPLASGKSLALGAGITVTAAKAATGDGFVDIGYIKSTGIALGAVSVSGDLGQIDAGGGTSATGLASLKVKTLGARDAAETQLAAGRSLVSNITGAIGSITVAGDIKTASIVTTNGVGAGMIGAVTIGGSLKGLAGATGSDNTGQISSSADIGLIKIGTLLTDGIVGGGGANSGTIRAAGKIAGLTVSGGIAGSTGDLSGSIHAGSTLGAVTVKGSLSGGAGADSGSISAAGIGAVSIGGSISAGGDTGSGVISSSKTIASVKIGGNIDGSTATGTASSAGGIRAVEKLGAVAITGDLKGGAFSQSGFIEGAADIASVTVNSIIGGAGQNSGTITAGGKIFTAAPAKPPVPGAPPAPKPAPLGVTVKGDIIGGSGGGSGSIFAGLDPSLVGDLGKVSVAGKITGGSQDNAGTINANGKITSVTVGPALAPATPLVLVKGGAGNFSGSIVSHGTMGAVKIMGHVEGGGGAFSGSIVSRDVITDSSEIAGSMGAVTIVGHLKGGAGADSGEVRSDGKLTSVIVGELTGAAGARSGSIRAGQGIVESGVVGAVTVKGTMTGSTTAQTGAIFSEGKITSVAVTGAVSGGSIRAGNNLGALTFGSDVTGALISARGLAVQSAASDLAIAKITIAGNAVDLHVRAGIDTASVLSNPDAQIGAVLVKGSWTRGDISAGVRDGGAAGFGTTGDAKIVGTDNVMIVSKIASITVTGGVVGTAASGDHFGFTAQQLGAVKIAGVNAIFTGTPRVSELLAGSTNDFTAREVAV